MSDGGESQSANSRFPRSEIWMMISVLIIGEVAGWGIAWGTRNSAKEVSKLFAEGAVTLLFGALLGGILQLLLADLDRGRMRRGEQVLFIGNVLADLKGVYEVDRGRTLIRAHQSAKTYGEEMRHFIEARVKLLNVRRALETDERAKLIPVSTREQVDRMQCYLRILIEEFEGHYKAISLAQNLFEAQLKRAMDNPKTSDADRDLPKNIPWQKIEELPQLQAFLLPSSTDGGDCKKGAYRAGFIDPLDEASRQLRDALHAQLSS